jgi:sialate O-acetylesterase
MNPHPRQFISPSVLARFAAYSLLLFLASFSPLRADVKLPAIFGDHMVLQRDISVPVWGTAAPGESVTVTAGGDKATATAGPDGKWSVKLDKLAASDKPIEVTITGKNTITLNDVLVGDVWVCSGQSNMEYGIKAFMLPAELAKAADPQIRIFSVPKWVAPAPAADIAAPPPTAPHLGSWMVCTPKSLSDGGEWSGFTAVGFYFGRDIHNFTHQPVGLIQSCWGGTRINSWTSLETLQAMPMMASFVKGAITFRDNYDKIKQTYLNETLPKWKIEIDKWNADNKAALDTFDTAMKDWREQVKKAAAEKKPGPPKPVGPKAPRPPRDVINDNQCSTALFNGMINPLIPYGIKGALWYQGEANADNPVFYKAALPALIKDWRTHWGEGDFPFIIVQLPNFMTRKPNPGESSWAGTREAQAKALDLPNTGVAVTIDLGEAGNIHPGDKQDVGYRAALAAERAGYDAKDAVTSGPTYKNSTVEGNKMRITFDNVGGGLAIGIAPEHYYTVEKQPVPKAPASELEGFAIAGADHKFVWAKAAIDGSAVVVSSDAVPAPVAVRYAWADNPACNLYNKEGLPAAPFRTDDFPFGK